jgi:hypothetical protein
MRMLEEKKPVIGSVFEKRMLEIKRLSIGNLTEPSNPQGAREHLRRGRFGATHI